MIIYKTTNLINGKFYIGKNSNNNPNYYGSGTLLNNAISKYGINNFKKEIIDVAKSLEELNEKEIFWIKYFGLPNKKISYNIALGGEGGDTISNHPRKNEIGKAHSRWLKNNHPRSMLGKYHSKKTKEIISEKISGINNGMYGKSHTYNTRLAISNGRKEYFKNMTDIEREEYSKMISRASIGKIMPARTNKWKENHSKFMTENNPFKGKTHSPDIIERIRNANKKPKSTEHKRKISIALKGHTPVNTKSVEIDGISYKSACHASRDLGINASTIRNRIRSKNLKFKNYKYV